MSLFKCEICLDALIMSLVRMYAMSINFYLGLLKGEACHISGGGCINTYLRNPICSTRSLACKTFSHPMAWWIYWQVDLRCLHSQCKSLMKWWQTSICFVLACWTGLLVNLIALSCHIAMALSWTWFQSHSKWPSSKVFVHNNYWWICIRLRRLIMQHYFVSLMTMKQVIFPTIDMCLRCSSFQPCILHNLS